MIYHSALKKMPPITNVTPVSRLTYGDSVAFQNDLTWRDPIECETADVFYSELPFPAGQKIFDERAGVRAIWREVIDRAFEYPVRLNCPAAFIAAKVRSDIIDREYQVQWVKLNGDPVRLYTRQLNVPDTIATNIEVMDWLAEQFDRVADFTCGYGLTAIRFLMRGKTFAVCDYDPKCIGVLARILHDAANPQLLKTECP